MLYGLKQRKLLSPLSDGGGLEPSPAKQQEAAEASDDIRQKEASPSSEDTNEETNEEVPSTPAINMEEITNHVKTTVEEEIKKSGMTDTELKAYELEQKKQQLEKREKELFTKELTANAAKLLSAAGISQDLANFVIGADFKETAANVKRFKDCLDKEVEKQVTERLKGKSPLSGNVYQGVGSLAKEQFLKGLYGE